MTAPSLRLRADQSEPICPAAVADALDELCAAGHLSGRARLTARAMAGHAATPVSDILVAAGWADPAALDQASLRRWRAGRADLRATPPPKALIDQVGVERCLTYGIVPWRQLGGAVVLACSDPARFDRFAEALPPDMGRPIMALATRSEVQDCIAELYTDTLIHRAETRGEPGMTCRNLTRIHPVRVVACMMAGAAAVWAAPHAIGLILLALTVLILAVTTAQKLITAMAALRATPRPVATPLEASDLDRAPSITLFVPLLREAQVAAKLITAMEALRYPRALLEIMILVEQDDIITRAALADLRMQAHMRVLFVPRGSLKTKPRAMNYALPFANGEIIGIYDAEDRPEPDQLLKVAAAFATAAPDVACLQGRLAFYNARQNLWSRCFALDYAAWFRLMLPGLAALNLPIPLGGTTLFLRRYVIDKLDGWDAHNVTEDAELGFRLYGAGYRVQLLDSTTFEEANCHIWPWIKQRSRWMKGYLKTWMVMMRKPVRLYRRLGAAGFVSFQVLVFGSLASAVSAPVLWSMVLPMMGIAHPLLDAVPAGLVRGVLAVLLLGEVVSLGIFMVVATARDLRWLLPWVAALPLYFLMATPAVLRAILETALNPHHWDKTEHGAGPACD